MKKRRRMTILVGLITLMLIDVLQAEDRDRNGSVRGMFIRLTEQKVGDEGYVGIVVKPFDRDDHVTVLVPMNREELVRAARRLQKGAKLGISFVAEAGHKWIREMEAELWREEREKEPEGGKRVTIRREVRREPGEGEERPERRRSRAARRDPEPERPRGRKERPDRRPADHLDQLQRQLREVVSGHLDRMSRSLREVLADHLWRMDAEFRELRARVDRMERELEELRATNERLRRELRERSGSRREREGQVQEQRENRERETREVRR
jgi:hypothetical protein